MPKTRLQSILFTIAMAFVMVYAMIVDNIALHLGGMKNEIFLMACQELAIMLPRRCPRDGLRREDGDEVGVSHRRSQRGFSRSRHCRHEWDDCPHDVSFDEPRRDSSLPISGWAVARNLGSDDNLEFSHGALVATLPRRASCAQSF